MGKRVWSFAPFDIYARVARKLERLVRWEIVRRCRVSHTLSGLLLESHFTPDVTARPCGVAGLGYASFVRLEFEESIRAIQTHAGDCKHL